MTGPRTGPSPLERSAAIAVALLLHFALIVFWPWRPPGVVSHPPTAPAIPIGFFRFPHAAIATAPQLLSGRRASPHIRGSPHGSIPAEVSLAEREIIDLGNGVTMTIDGNPPSVEPRRTEWLQMDVWVSSQPIVPPHPSDYCVPGQPRMPERAIDHELTGKVTATYVVDSVGVATQIELEAGAEPILSRAVSDWLHGCLFVPAHQGGKRTIAKVKQSFLFEIR